MKIVADENIPFAELLFSPLGDVELYPGREIQSHHVKNADALIVRSVTQVNEQLLAGSGVKFVGTCTIGVDHLDQEYMDRKGIRYASAPGCNAGGVVQYALTAMSHFGLLEPAKQKNLKAGVLGCGSVGGRVLMSLDRLGIEVIGVDPFLSKLPNGKAPSAFEELYRCDVICAHTPYTTTGTAPTKHLLNTDVFKQLKPGALLINAGRGGVCNNDELLAYLKESDDLRVVLDVWEAEPNILPELLDRVSIGTPHIAGYSYEGRINGSLMIHKALLADLERQGLAAASMNDGRDAVLAHIAEDPATLTPRSQAEMISQTYDILRDDADLRAAVSGLPASFDALRKNYHQRREFSHFLVPPLGDSNLEKSMGHLGFQSMDVSDK